MTLRFPGVRLSHRPRASALMSGGPTPWRSPREGRTSDQPTSAGTAAASPPPVPLRHIMYIFSATSQHWARGASGSSSAYGPHRAACRARFGVGCHVQMIHSTQFRAWSVCAKAALREERDRTLQPSFPWLHRLDQEPGSPSDRPPRHGRLAPSLGQAHWHVGVDGRPYHPTYPRSVGGASSRDVPCGLTRWQYAGPGGYACRPGGPSACCTASLKLPGGRPGGPSPAN